MVAIYKIVPGEMWKLAERDGVFKGAPVDKADGYIHFSTSSQVRETAMKHFAGVDGLLLVAFDSSSLGNCLKWESSRGGELFPHLYGELPTGNAKWIKELPLAPDGQHNFPDLDD